MAMGSLEMTPIGAGPRRGRPRTRGLFQELVRSADNGTGPKLEQAVVCPVCRYSSFTVFERYRIRKDAVAWGEWCQACVEQFETRGWFVLSIVPDQP